MRIVQPNRGLVMALAGALALLGASQPGHAQCDNSWEAGPIEAPPLLGADGPIHAIWTWSLPGQPAQLIVGGDFTHIGGIAANNIAAWDGARWHELADGRSGPVFALATYNTALIAGGNGSIASWNGSTWGHVGTPLPTSQGDYPNCFALAVFNGELYAGGDFEWINSNPGHPTLEGNLWKYNGSGPWPWSRVPAGVGSAVRALQVFDADGAGANPPALYVGGENGNLRKWDGMTATNIAGPYANTLNQPGDVYALTVVNPIGLMAGGLIVGGNFSLAPQPGGGGGNIQVHSIARFDGTNWSAMAGGVDGTVNALRAFGADLYVGGSFGSAGSGPVTVYNFARFNGSQWFNPGNGAGTIYEMREFNGQLIVGGSFGSVGGGTLEASRIARWSGAAWSAFTEPFSINALARIGSRIVMGGNFSHDTTGGFPPVTTNRYNISTWDLVNEGGLGWGTNGSVRALLGFSTGSGASLTNHIVAGGDFTVCGPDMFGAAVAANRVAIWAESATTPAEWRPMGTGFNGSVNALERFNGWTVAGGSFTATGGPNRVAKYVGSPPSWQPLTSPDPDINGNVFALKAFSDALGGTNNYLVIGGDFTAATPTGVAANRILMRRENPVPTESGYQALGAGFNGAVYAIERFGTNNNNTRTYAAGAFTASGGVTCNRIARLNGANWEAVPPGDTIGFNGAVYALKNIGGYLYAAGSFTSVGGIPANRVARWNGSVWSAASSGTSDLVFALMGYQTEAIAGGVFVDAGGLLSPGAARHKASGVPWIQRPPLSQSRNCGQNVYFDLELPEGYETATFQWRKDGVPLSDGPTGTGSDVFNAQGQYMTIGASSPADNGAYDCVVTNACGSATSSAATLTVNPCCTGDLNGDGSVNVSDLLALITAWGACANPGNCPADLNNDDIVNVTDLLALITEWGPC